jgi:hypothetical protein
LEFAERKRIAFGPETKTWISGRFDPIVRVQKPTAASLYGFASSSHRDRIPLR